MANYEYKPNQNNSVILVGRVTKDAEVRQTRNGYVSNFSVAYNKRKKVGDEWVTEKTVFVDCTMFNCPLTITKGMKVTVQGSLDQSEWTAKDGTQRRKTFIMVGQISTVAQQTFTSGGQEATQTMTQPSSTYPVAPRTEEQIVADTVESVFGTQDSDIPF